jgi:ADP-ribosylglycohydrolase
MDAIENHAERIARARLSLEGLSVGDALGERFFYDFDAPQPTYSTAERALQRIRARQLPPAPWRTTDDTAMALSIVETLDHRGGIDGDELARRFAARYAADPNRGYGGMAHQTLQAIGEGHPWREVSRSAFDGQGSMGNGGAMRVGPVGAFFADDLDAAREHAARSAEVTHAHPDGQAGAVAVAVAAAGAWRMRGEAGRSAEELLDLVVDYTPEGPTRSGLRFARGLPEDCPVQRAAEDLGSGSMVIASDTVPFAVWCAARHLDDFEEAFWATVSGLGDCDTTCAIVGGIVALAVGEEGLPGDWIRAREPL